MNTTLKIMSDDICYLFICFSACTGPMAAFRLLISRQILVKNQTLQFSLLRLQLVELIRNCKGGDIQPALNFATEQLGPRAPSSPDFLDDLEKTMSLVFFPPDAVPPELKRLLEPGLRREVAAEVNKVILGHVSRRREAALHQLVRMRAWAEATAREKKLDLPGRIDLGFAADENEAMEDRAHENGHEAMITT